MKQNMMALLLAGAGLSSCEMSRSQWEKGNMRLTIGGSALDVAGGEKSGGATGQGENSRESPASSSESSKKAVASAVAAAPSVVMAWDEGFERRESMTGRVRANLEIGSTPLVMKGMVAVQGRVHWEQEIEPWFIYTRTSKLDGRVTETKKVVDPPKFMDSLPDHDERLSARDIPANLRQSTAAIWRSLLAKDSTSESVTWRLDTIPELLGQDSIAGRVVVDPNGYFSIDIAEAVVRKLENMSSPFLKLIVEASAKPANATQVVKLEKGVFNEAMDLLYSSAGGAATGPRREMRPSAAPRLPPGLPTTARWTDKPELNEVPTGRDRAEFAFVSGPVAQRRQVSWLGTAVFEHEIAPWHVYRLLEEYSVAGKIARYERKVVDPPEYRDLIPDYDPFKSPQDIPAGVRIPTENFWRKYSPREMGECWILWSIAGEAEQLLGSEASGRVKVSVTGQFKLEFPSDLVVRLSTLGCDAIDVRLVPESIQYVEVLQKLPRQVFTDAALTD